MTNAERQARCRERRQAVVVLCEHDVTGGDLEQPFRADGRKLTKERRYAPTSVHVRRIPRSRSPDLAFNFTGMRTTLAECAHGAVRTKNSQFYGYHRALAGRIGYKRAILATAHKLLRVIHAVLRNDRPYTDPGIDYQQMVVERNAPRWLRMLRQYGFLEEARATARS